MGKEMKTVHVCIFDRNYSLRTTDDPSYLGKLVDDLNGRIEKTGNNMGRYSDIQVLSLIALQILDEKAKVEKEMKQLKDLAKKMELGRNKK